MPLTAKYATTCGSCGQPIRPGDAIVAMPSTSGAARPGSAAGRGGSQSGARTGTRWAHEGCQGALDLGAAFAPPAAGEPGDVDALDGRTASGPAPDAVGTERTIDVTADAATDGAATVVYTDGACSGNPGPGGWAWAVDGGAQGSGGEPHTTNQRMEITAALEAVRALSGPLVVVSDSTYVVNCFRDRWWQGWLARGWVNSAKKPVANRDLWEPLVDLVRRRGDVRFEWVKGHSGDRMNDLVDTLAVAAAKDVVAGAER